MRYNYIFVVLGVLFLVSSCQQDPKEDGRQTIQVKQALDLKPEQVIKFYQSHIDSNRFEMAKALSTEAGRIWIDTLASIINSSEEMDSTFLQTTFSSILCAEKNDTAYCNCILTDQDGAYEQAYILVKQSGQWKVDAPEDDGLYFDDNAIREIIEQWQDY